MVDLRKKIDADGLAFIYSGLNIISDKGRKRLSEIAQLLVAVQNNPGSPVPGDICRDIMRSSGKVGYAQKGALK